MSGQWGHPRTNKREKKLRPPRYIIIIYRRFVSYVNICITHIILTMNVNEYDNSSTAYERILNYSYIYLPGAIGFRYIFREQKNKQKYYNAKLRQIIARWQTKKIFFFPLNHSVGPGRAIKHFFIDGQQTDNFCSVLLFQQLSIV